MSDFPVHIYRFFLARKRTFYFLLAACTVTVGYFASHIRFEEDISQSVSGNEKNDNFGYVVRNLKISDKLIADLTLSDSLSPVNPGELGVFGQMFVDSLNARFDTGYIRNITFKTSDTAMANMMDLVMGHLPAFFEEPDLKILDSLLLPGSIETALEKNYKILVSPASMVLKKRIQEDPLGISTRAFAKLKSLKGGENFEFYNGCIYTSDLRHLLIFILPANPSAETSRNTELIQGLDEIIQSLKKGPDSRFRIQYF